MEVTELLLHIAAGEYDKDLQRIKDGAYNRLRLIQTGEAAERLATLERGDIVKFISDMRPKYLGGAQAVVTGFEDDKVILRMLETRTYGRKTYRYGGRVTCPASIVRATGGTTNSQEQNYEYGT